jgi:hypothetical protein
LLISLRGALTFSPGDSYVATEAKKPMFTQVAAQRNHPDTSQDEIERAAMRPAHVGFAALRALDSHRQQSPWNLRLGEVGRAAQRSSERKQALPLSSTL